MDFLGLGVGGTVTCFVILFFYEKHSADIMVIESSKDVFVLRGTEALAGRVPLTPANVPPSNPY